MPSAVARLRSPSRFSAPLLPRLLLLGLISLLPAADSTVSPPPPPVASSWCSSTSAVVCYDANYGVNGSTWQDLSGNANHLTLYSYGSNVAAPASITSVTPVTAAASGVYLAGSSGNGNGYFLNVGPTKPVYLGTTFTFIAWVYPLSAVGPPFLWSVGRDLITYNNQAAMQLNSFTDRTPSAVGFGSSIPSGSNAGLTTNITVTSAWYHIAFVRTGLSGAYYLNGQPNGVVTAATSVTYDTQNFTIACDYRNLLLNINPRCLNGYISNLIIVNTSMTSAQILSDFQAGNGHVAPPPAPNPPPSPSPPSPRPPPPSPPLPSGRHRSLLQQGQQACSTVSLFTSASGNPSLIEPGSTSADGQSANYSTLDTGVYTVALHSPGAEQYYTFTLAQTAKSSNLSISLASSIETLQTVAAVGSLLNAAASASSPQANATADAQSSLQTLVTEVCNVVLQSNDSVTNPEFVSAAVAALGQLLNIPQNVSSPGSAALPVLPQSTVSDVLSAAASIAGGAASAGAATVQSLVRVATAALAAGNASPAGLSVADVSTGLGILSVAASGNVSAETANLVLGGLTLLVNASVLTAQSAAPPTSGSAPPGAASPPPPSLSQQVLSAVGGIVSALAAAMSSSAATNCSSAVAASPVGGIAVSCVSQNGTSPLYSAGLSLPSGAAVMPLPPAALAGASGNSTVVSQFISLAFDPYGGNCTSTVSISFFVANGTGLTAVPVHNLSQPIVIVLPSAGLTNASVVRYWDTGAGAYSSEGLVTAPNVIPPNSNLGWRANFSAGSTSELALAWVLSAPSCSELFLNCSDEWERSQAISLDPENRLGQDPLVVCSQSAGGMMRVYSGTSCLLWQQTPDGCVWDIWLQAFHGPGCIVSNVTQAATTHLTTFGVSAMPNIAVASPADFVESPAELARLRPLLIALAALCASMHALAWALNHRDQADMRRIVAHAFSSRAGCAVHANGLFTWRLSQTRLSSGAPVDVVSGPAVEFAGLVGVPLARLAFAIPESLFGGQQPRHSTGRHGGIAPSHLAAHHDEILGSLSHGLVCTSPAAWLWTRRLRDSLQSAVCGRADSSSRIESAMSSEEHHAGMANAVLSTTAAARAACSSSNRAGDSGDVGDDDNPAEGVCVFCLERLALKPPRPVLVAGCSHAFHIACLTDAARYGHLACPVCRAPLEDIPGVNTTTTAAAPPAAPSRVAALVATAVSAKNDDSEPPTDGWLLERDTRLRARWPPPAAFPASDDEAGADLLELSSTALMHAFLQSWSLRTAEAIAEQQMLFITHRLVSESPDLGSETFLRLFRSYQELMMGHLFLAGWWMARARMFRVLLLQQNGGWWEPTQELAVVLQASQHATLAQPRRGLQRVVEVIQTLILAASSEGLAGGGDLRTDAYDGMTRRDVDTTPNAADDAYESLSHEHWQPAAADVPPPSADDETSGGGLHADDPLYYTETAITSSTPHAVHLICAGDRALAERLWATALTVAFLEGQNFAFLSENNSQRPRTLIDEGDALLVAHLGDRASTRVMAAARVQLAHWSAAADYRTTASRAAHQGSRVYVVMQFHQSLSRLLNSLIARYNTLAMCCSFYSVGSRRWHAAMLLGSTTLSMLVMQLWLFWSKAETCCGDVRAMLGCSRDTSAPCHGFTGLCADLTDNYAAFGMVALGRSEIANRPVAITACRAFPADGSASDAALAGLISFACSFPVAAILSVLFSLSLSSDNDQPHGRVRFMSWPLRLRIFLGAPNWRFARQGAGWIRGPRFDSTVARWWVNGWTTSLVVAATDLYLTQSSRGVSSDWRRLFRWRSRRRRPPALSLEDLSNSAIPYPLPLMTAYPLPLMSDLLGTELDECAEEGWLHSLLARSLSATSSSLSRFTAYLGRQPPLRAGHALLYASVQPAVQRAAQPAA